MSWWNALLTPITDIVKEPLKGWQERKTLKVQSEVEVAKLNASAAVETAKATVEMAKKGLQVQADWDSVAQKNMKSSIMDEIIAITFLLPIWVVFFGVIYEFITVPGTIISVAMISAVSSLAAFPLWFVCLECGIVASYLGLRWLVQPLIQGLTGNFGKTKPTMKLTSTKKEDDLK